MTYPSSVSHEAIALRLVFYIHMYGFFPYDGYYSETDRTGAVQKTIY